MRTAIPLLGLLGCPLPPPSLDIAPPTVASMVPPADATDVAPGTALQVCFDAPLRVASLTAAAVQLSRADGHSTHPVAITTGLDDSATCLAIAPAAPLSPASHYQLTLRNTLLGSNGVALEGSKTVDAYVSSFSTAGAPANAVLLVPADGTLSAPLDLAQIIVAFDAPVTLAGTAGPLSISPTNTLPGGEPSILSADGRLATSPFTGAPAGAQIQITLSPGLADPSGQPPLSDGPLGFTMGGCSEASAPNVGGGFIAPRDVDAWLQFPVDRPGLCGALVEDPGSPNAGVLRASAAACSAPYDPCTLSLLCTCSVPLAPLGAGDTLTVTPELTGYDGQVGAGSPLVVQTSGPLPALVFTEVLPGAKSVAFIEVQNRGAEPIDLTGLQLADCGLSLGCASLKTSPVPFGSPGGRGSATLAADGYALLVDATFDASQLPTDTLLLSPLNGVSMLHLSTSGFQSLGLFLPELQTPVSTYDGSLLPRADYSFERIDPGATDATPNDWAISTALGGTPGACNSVTPGAACDP